MPHLSELLSNRSDKEALDRIAAQNRHKSKKRGPDRQKRRTQQPREQGRITLPDFVAIDLETTGLDAKKDRIIEIGLVRFIGGKAVDDYATLVNPQTPIPRLITELTGITDEQVAAAPKLEQVLDTVIAFIGEYPLCGHQVDFDFSFLNEECKRAGRADLANEQLDSAVLARIALPGLPGYSLSAVSKYLAVALTNAHRALDDARACGEAAAMLVPRLSEIKPDVRRIMAGFAPASVLKTILFKSVNFRKMPQAVFAARQTVQYPKLGLPDACEQLELARVQTALAEDGPLAGLLDGYTAREGQIAMAHNVTQALNSGEILVAEAGTGTGKSLAYLLPAALWALHNNSRVLISTHTRNLQDQLIAKELPIVQKLAGAGLRYSVLKGRSNYLCKHRWQRLLNRELGNLSKRERFGILPLIRWAEETATGDIEGQSQFNRKWFAKVWNLVSADSHECLGWRCPLHGECFLQQARRKALSSHVVVINHGLFFSDICAESSFLGPLGPIVFDEAHHLEHCGHRYLRVQLDTNRITRFVDFTANLLKVLEKRRDEADMRDKVKAFGKTLKRLRKQSNDFLSDLAAHIIRANPKAPVRYEIPYRDDPFRGLSNRAGFEIVINDLQDALHELSRSAAAESVEQLDLATDITACIDKTSQLKADLQYLVRASTEDHVFWAEGDREKGWVKLCGVPLDIGGLLEDIWYKSQNTAVFTSATLSVSGSLDYFREKAGLNGPNQDRTRCEMYPSPFIEQQMLRCAVAAQPTPDHPDYPAAVADAVKRLMMRFDKNILVLFTANAMLDAVLGILKSDHSIPDSKILAQGPAVSRHLLLDRFRETRGSALLGTDSFWEGIDVPGEACEIVVIPRLPFPVPSNPLVQALCNRNEQVHGDSFFSYCVPEAVIKFRQGAGRLIRRPEDRGALVVLDNRMATRGYGKKFMRSLEGDFIRCEDIDAAAHEIASFFRRA